MDSNINSDFESLNNLEKPKTGASGKICAVYLYNFTFILVIEA